MVHKSKDVRVRIPQQLYEELLLEAEERGVSISKVAREAMSRHSSYKKELVKSLLRTIEMALSLAGRNECKQSQHEFEADMALLNECIADFDNVIEQVGGEATSKEQAMITCYEQAEKAVLQNMGVSQEKV